MGKATGIRRTAWMVLAAGWLIFTAMASAWAQAPEVAPVGEDVAASVGEILEEAVETTNGLQETTPLQRILKNGGWPMWVLAVMSVIGVALTIYFLLVQRAGQLMPARFIGEIQGLLKAGRLREARDTCIERRCAAAAIARSAIDYALGTENPDPGLVKEIIEGEGSRQAGLLRDQVQYLHDIAVIAPMVGLLGTVFGMLKAFSAVAHDIAKVKPMYLADGVSQALVTTAAGLLVGIPAMMAFAYFRGRTSRLIAALEAASADMLTALVQGRSK